MTNDDEEAELDAFLLFEETLELLGERNAWTVVEAGDNRAATLIKFIEENDFDYPRSP